MSTTRIPAGELAFFLPATIESDWDHSRTALSRFMEYMKKTNVTLALEPGQSFTVAIPVPKSKGPKNIKFFERGSRMFGAKVERFNHDTVDITISAHNRVFKNRDAKVQLEYPGADGRQQVIIFTMRNTPRYG